MLLKKSFYFFFHLKSILWCTLLYQNWSFRSNLKLNPKNEFSRVHVFSFSPKMKIKVFGLSKRSYKSDCGPKVRGPFLPVADCIL